MAMGLIMPPTSPTEILLSDLVRDQDPPAAFAKLRQLMAGSAAIADDCHMLTHTIGNAAFAKYGSFEAAIKYNDDLCGSGYVHALIINSFSEVPDPTTMINTICAGRDGYCYHGIGHGTMFFTQNDVPRSLALCATLDTSEHQARCSEGVFMQNFESTKMQMYPTPYFYPDDSLKVCRETPNFKTACYIYAGEYFAQQWKTNPQLFSLCSGSEKGYVNECVSGIGDYLMAVNLANPQKALSVCDNAPDTTTTAACVDGLVSYYLVNYNSIAQTQTFCNTLSGDDNTTCNASLQARAPYYK